MAFAPKGASHSSHGETIAGLDRLLKDRSATGRAAPRRPGGPSLTNLSRPARLACER